MVSKLLLKKRHNDYKHELKISKRLQHSKKLKFNVDNHFCTIQDHCYLKHNEIPNQVRYDDLYFNDKKRMPVPSLAQAEIKLSNLLVAN